MSESVTNVIEHDIGPNGLLAIRVPSSEVRVRAVEGSTVRVQDPGGTLERSLRVERAPGSLSLQAERGVAVSVGSVGFGAWRRVPNLDIEAPFGTTIVVETASGDVTVHGLTGDQRYRTASGELDLREIAGRLTVDAVSGDVGVTTAGPCTIAARTVSGDLSILGVHERPSVRVATTSGDIRLEGRFEGPGPFSVESVSGDTILVPTGGVRLEVKTVTGDVSTDIKATSAGGRGARTVIVGDGGVTMTLRSISGDVVVQGRDAMARVGAAPTPPTPPEPPSTPERPEPALTPEPPEPPSVPEDPTERIHADASDQPMTILEALERGEIDVDEATRRIVALGDATDDGASA